MKTHMFRSNSIKHFGETPHDFSFSDIFRDSTSQARKTKANINITYIKFRSFCTVKKKLLKQIKTKQRNPNPYKVRKIFIHYTSDKANIQDIKKS